MKDRKTSKISLDMTASISSQGVDGSDEPLIYTDQYHGNHFLKKLHELYQQEQLCDIQLIVENEKICTHKAVLAANSSYFEVMFLSNMVEKDRQDIEIKGISYPILKSLVDFCYTASVKVNIDNALDLLSAANMLQFEGIKQCCSTYLQTKLDAHNCLNIANFAELHTCYNLKESAEDFSKIHFREVVKSEEFLHIPYEQLKVLLGNDALSVVSEKDVFEAIVEWIKHDETERKTYFLDLFRMVRLQHLPPKLLVDCVETHPYVQENRSCLKLISEIKTYQLLPTHHHRYEDQNIIENEAAVKQRSLHSESCIYMLGGETRSQVFDTVDCYSFQTSKWNSVSRMSKSRDGLGVATYDGNIFAAGGIHEKATSIPVSLPFSICANICGVRQEKDAFLNTLTSEFSYILYLNFDVKVFRLFLWKITSKKQSIDLHGKGLNWFPSEGYDGKDSLDSCECYITEKNTWQPIAPMNFKRHAFSMAHLHGWLYAGGGSDFVSTEYNSVESYDPIRDEWYDIASMSSKREGLVFVPHDNVLYALGGENGVSILNTVERYDPRSGIWYNCSPMGYRRRYFGAVSLNDKIYSIGGSDYEEDLNTVELFEARYNRWIPIPSMNKRRESVAVVAIDNRIFALGGACVNKETDTVECYDPSLNRWESFGVIPKAKEGMGAVAL